MANYSYLIDENYSKRNQANLNVSNFFFGILRSSSERVETSIVSRDQFARRFTEDLIAEWVDVSSISLIVYATHRHSTTLSMYIMWVLLVRGSAFPVLPTVLEHVSSCP